MERNFRSRGVDVKIRESRDQVELELDGVPIDVSVVDGKYQSQTAHMFREFETIDEVVETLLKNEGRVWKLHGGPPAGGHGGHGGHGGSAGGGATPPAAKPKRRTGGRKGSGGSRGGAGGHG